MVLVVIYGRKILESYGARSAPAHTYGFSGATCISLNNEIAHGVPSDKIILREGDAVNIDASAEQNGYWADNGSSVVLGKDIHKRNPLVETSTSILRKAVSNICSGVWIADIGKLIETLAHRNGYKLIKNLGGHRVGKSLHEEADCILNFYDKFDRRRFKKDSVIALETFISTNSTMCRTAANGWTLIGNREGTCV